MMSDQQVHLTADGNNKDGEESLSDNFVDDDDDGALSVALTANSTTTENMAVGTRTLEETEERKTLTRSKEAQAVLCWRFVVYIVVLVAAILVCLAVYSYATDDQQEDFETQFGAFATKVTESFYDAVELKIGAIQSFSTAVTAHAVTTGASWPNVTIPYFELQAAHSRIQAAGVSVYWYPLVTDTTRAGWEAYAMANRNWMKASFLNEMKWKARQDYKFGLGKYDQQQQEEDNNRLLQEQGSTNGEGTSAAAASNGEEIVLEDGFHPNIVEVETNPRSRPLGSGPYLPFWQVSPVLPMMKFLNVDILQHDAAGPPLKAAVQSKQIIMGNLHNHYDPNDTENEAQKAFNAFLQHGQYRHDLQTYQGDPTTTLVVPVFTDFEGATPEERTVGGVLQIALYWRLNFVDVLPDTAKGIVCVLENTLNQTFSYRIDGAQVTALGVGDHHDPKYSDMVVSQDVTERLENRAGPQNQAFDVADFNTEYCRYKIHIYPSQATEDEYVNSDPILFTLVVACVFFFTSIIFIAYDCLVARRQHTVMTKAVQSAAIVSSLYPKQVRDRLFNDTDDNNKQKEGDSAWKTNDSRELALENMPVQNTPMIADDYDACTVLFADLAGFTKWSASRRAEDVFYLLETIYACFDKVAAKRLVFKVETIGDCYVAVTGLPNPQPNHAVIMVKFARDCYAKLNNLLPTLASKLGEDTASLNFRVGLHSGSVVAGCLRGQKSRFQLFGDTMNTASRMESNGIAGRIHISQATADELRAHGWGKALVKREDKIVAKGKGEMQTYFVSIQRNAGSMTSAGTSMSRRTLDVGGSSERRIDNDCHDVNPEQQQPNQELYHDIESDMVERQQPVYGLTMMGKGSNTSGRVADKERDRIDDISDKSNAVRVMTDIEI